MANVYSVSQVNSYIKNMFTQDFMLNHIFIKGEVSNCKYHSSGHVYFTLKDQSGTIAGILFAGNKKSMNFQMKEGQNVIVEGSITIYERDGKYQLYAKNIILDGAGLLYQKYEDMKNRLEEMGMFSSEYKKPIPRYAEKLGIVTAKTGAAVQDIINIAKRRNPYIQLYLYPAQVQGEGAKESIVQGIEILDAMGLDIIIIGRGGGSIEDLWAFNEEIVARAIFDCNTPIISAVGHETDVTIADYIADLRAPTPSAAAELAVEDYEQMVQRLLDSNQRLKQLLRQKIVFYQNKLEQYKLHLKLLSPSHQILQKKQYLIDLEDKLTYAMNDKIKEYKHQLALYIERLSGLSPLNKLGKGYAYIQNQSGIPIKKIEQVSLGETLNIKLIDGEILALVNDMKKE
ncbi:MAG: exodeoxyribonuclease VII large subunit [Clostridiales bacterium]|nr:exodeoxyribonuclease VII large subunit [Clostridiales bacterium]